MTRKGSSSMLMLSDWDEKEKEDIYEDGHAQLGATHVCFLYVTRPFVPSVARTETDTNNTHLQTATYNHLCELMKFSVPMSWGPNTEEELTTLLGLAMDLERGVPIKPPRKEGEGQPSGQRSDDDDADSDDDLAVCMKALKADQRRERLQEMLGGEAGQALFGSKKAAMAMTRKVGAWTASFCLRVHMFLMRSAKLKRK